MTIIIAMANTKGGSGKTTLSLVLSEQFAKDGNKVAIIDVDKQQTAFRWAAERTAAQRTNPFDVTPIANEDTSLLHEALASMKGNYDYVFIDLPGHENHIVANAISFAHLVIIPVNIGREEVRGALNTLKFIKEQEMVLQRTIARRIVVTNTGAGAVAAAGETGALADIDESELDRIKQTLRNSRPLKDLFTYQMTIEEQSQEMAGTRKTAMTQINRVEEDSRTIAGELVSVLEELANV